MVDSFDCFRQIRVVLQQVFGDFGCVVCSCRRNLLHLAFGIINGILPLSEKRQRAAPAFALGVLPFHEERFDVCLVIIVICVEGCMAYEIGRCGDVASSRCYMFNPKSYSLRFVSF